MVGRLGYDATMLTGTGLQMMRVGNDTVLEFLPCLGCQFRLAVQDGFPCSKRNRDITHGIHARTLLSPVDVFAVEHNNSISASQNSNSIDVFTDQLT